MGLTKNIAYTCTRRPCEAGHANELAFKMDP